MKPTIPSQNTELLKSLLNKSIISIKRQIFESDMDLNNYEQVADGTTEFTFNNGTVVCFFAMTEINSVGVNDNLMQSYGNSCILLNLSNSLFWQRRINQEIETIEILQSTYASTDNPSEFGVELKFKNGTYVCIEYLNEGDSLDTIRILEKYEGSQYIRRAIC